MSNWNKFILFDIYIYRQFDSSIKSYHVVLFDEIQWVFFYFNARK